MRVALTGVSGFIGSVTARRLAAAGHQVTGLVRPTSRRDHIETHVDRFVVGTQDDPDVWADLLEDADSVIHNSVDWSPLGDTPDLRRHLHGNLVASIELLHAAAPRQFIFLSTIAVHHEMRPRWDGVIDEDHPLRPALLYGAYKAAVEAHLWSAHVMLGMPICAVRPCGVYGIDPALPRTIGYPIVRKVAARKPYRRSGGGKFVHVEDVAATLVAAVGNPAADGQVFNLVDCYARWADWARIASELLGVTVEIDESSPSTPKNRFTKDAVAALGVDLDRGHGGIREHLATLVQLLREADAI